jgi:KaiC/GvpD/RAD55 family RecA-like ATPase
MAFVFGFEKIKLVDSLPEGSNIILIGPVGSGKSYFSRRFFYNNVTRNAAGVIITTRKIGEDILDWFDQKNLIMDLDRFGVIDCIARTLNLDFYPKDYSVLKRVSSPHDLEGVEKKLDEYWNSFNKKGFQNILVIIDTLTNFFARAPSITVLRFVYNLTSKIKSSNGVSLFLVDSGLLDAATVNTLKNLTQGIIEMRVEDKNYIRFINKLFSTEWEEYRLINNDIEL